MGIAIYFIGIIDGLHQITFASATIIVTVSLCVIFGNWINNTDKNDSKNIKYTSIRKFWYKIFIVGLAIMIIAKFIPDSKTLAAMIIMPKIVESNAFEKVKDTPEKAIDLLNLKLDEYIKDAKKKSE